MTSRSSRLIFIFVARSAPKPDVQDTVLVKSARRCALCYGLNGSLVVVRGQIAHVDRDSSNSGLGNLAFLCMDHHDEYDSKTSQSKGYRPGELIQHRDALHEAIARGDHRREGSVPTTPLPTEVLEHDRAAFRAADALMPERAVRDVLEQLATHHAILSSGLLPLDMILDHFELESNRFLSAELDGAAETLVLSLDRLSKYVIQHFFVPDRPGGQGPDGASRLALYPELNMDRNLRATAADMTAYDDYAEQLRAVIGEAADAYRVYRRAVKRLLVL